MLKQITLVLFIVCLTLVGYSQNPYVFGGPEINSLLPFEKHELMKMKASKVKTVTLAYSNTFHTKITHSFNKEGQVISSTYTEGKGKKERIWMTGIYKYDKHGQLILCRSLEGSYEHYDSLVYNNEGRLIHLYGYETNNSKRRKLFFKNVYYNASMESIDSNFTILREKNQYDSTAIVKFILNRKNECVKIINGDCVDSLATETIRDSSIKKYLHKCSKDSIFKLGMEIIYKNSRALTEKHFAEGNPEWLKESYKYVYDEYGQLLYKSNELSPYQNHHFYLYQRHEGLRHKEVQVNWDETKTTTYSYNFWRQVDY